MESDPFFEALVGAFAELGAGHEAVSRTLLLDQRHFVGHCYRCGAYRAIWKPGSPTIDFFDAQGRAVRTVSLDRRQMPKAA
jgi:hypothetical protein